jgi:transglutaminase-like putative cysteine protease
MKTLQIRHVTVYRYNRPVRFGIHRLMFRPRDSHDMRLLDTRLTISPPARVRWVHDVFGNSIAFATINSEADELRFASEILLEHFAYNAPEFPIDEMAETYPFQYPPDELPDLMPSIERRFPDPDGALGQWIKQFYDGTPVRTQDLLVSMTLAIKKDLTYRARAHGGIQTPVQTLSLGEGTCRDYAVLMIEALRTLGLAARFVSGYLYDAAADVSPTGLVGGAATHAWTQVYVPGAGWMEFDPTNGMIGGENLIRVAVARDPAQAVPLQGSYQGPKEAFVSMDVDVQVNQVSTDCGERCDRLSG